ncbi:MAG: GvpL/GvpF family gas vesicle protein [Acidobacteria bacterium]|nr:GvpL/GvpF family gas vesicle protein [Acidobacteriota bacterium]MBV9475178.1 GvpL/GvpF family gas vesicle protein [Acidobacteriota bacterium]
MRFVVIGAHRRRDDIDAPAEALACGELFLSALPIADEQPVSDRELLVAVAKLRARLLDRATFVAIRYGLAVRDSAEGESKCAAHLPRWTRLLDAHRDDVEMTLKAAAAAARPRPDRRDFTSGAEYLRALHEATNASAADPAFVKEAEARILPFAKKHRWSHRDEKSIELAALVPRARVEDVRAAGEELRRTCAQVPFLLSGPWPLEVFADDADQ